MLPLVTRLEPSFFRGKTVAFLPQSEKEKEEQGAIDSQQGNLSEGAPAPTGNQESGTIQQSSQGAPSGAAQQGVQQDAGTARGTGYVNFQRYKQENEPQTQRMADNVQTKVQNSVQEANRNLQDLRSNVEQQTQQAAYDKEKFKQQAQNAAANKDALADIINQRYQGPETAADLDTQGLLDSQRTASNQLQNAQSGAGREVLMRDLYQRPVYSRGASSLDAALVGGSKDFNQNVGQLASENDFGAKNKQFDEWMADRVGAAQQSYQDVRKQALDDLMAQLTSSTSGWEKELAGMNAARRAEETALTDRYSGMKDEKMVDYLRGVGGDYTLGNVIDKDEAASYQALVDLLQTGGRDVQADARFADPVAAAELDKLYFDQKAYDAAAKAAKAADEKGPVGPGYEYTSKQGAQVKSNDEQYQGEKAREAKDTAALQNVINQDLKYKTAKRAGAPW